MKNLAAPLALAVALGVSACTYQLEAYDPYLDAVTVPTGNRTIASVSQDAGLSLAAGAAPGTENGFFYDWRRRDAEQRIQQAQREQLYQRRQAAGVP
jgi:hypothetical protein